MRKLEQQVNEGQRGARSGTSHGTNYHKDTTCFNCNEKGHISPNCPKKNTDAGNAGGNDRQASEGDDGNRQRSAARTAPKEGEPETKTVDGEETKWCGKCHRWTKGDKKHSTTEHKRQLDSDMRVAGGLTAAEEEDSDNQTNYWTNQKRTMTNR
jgi:hypothetical protein